MSPSSTLPKHLREVQRKLKQRYKIVPSGGGHFHIRNGADQLVLARNGEVLSLPGTPAGGSLNKRTLQDLELAQVLQGTPLRTTEHLTPEQREEAARKKRDAARERSKNRQKVADELYERLEAVLKPVGGTEMLGIKADLSYIGAMLAREHDATSLTPDLLAHSIQRVLNRHWVTPAYQEIWNRLAEHLETAEDLREEYFTLLRRARGLPEEVVVSSPTQLKLPEAGNEEWPFMVALIRLDECMVDHNYQRPVPWPFVRQIAATFDEVLVGTIDVSQRRGRYAIMDGQLRFEAMRMVGKTTCWASVYVGLDAEAEARFFLKKNSDRKAIHPYYIYKAKLAANDPTMLAITKIVHRFDYEVSLVSAQSERAEENAISAIAALEKAYSRSSERYPDCLTPTLGLLRQTTLGLRQGQNASLIHALSLFFESFPEYDEGFLVEAMQRRSPEWLLSKAREDKGKATTKAMLATIVGEYNRGIPRGERLKVPS